MPKPEKKDAARAGKIAGKPQERMQGKMTGKVLQWRLAEASDELTVKTLVCSRTWMQCAGSTKCETAMQALKSGS